VLLHYYGRSVPSISGWHEGAQVAFDSTRSIVQWFGSGEQICREINSEKNPAMRKGHTPNSVTVNYVILASQHCKRYHEELLLSTYSD
jgi:hypothetical protein